MMKSNGGRTMRPDDVPGHLIVALDHALYQYAGIAVMTKQLRHALAAVIPIIEAQEREACAKVAERRWRNWPGIHPDDAKKGEVCDDVTACADIAAAIRARGA